MIKRSLTHNVRTYALVEFVLEEKLYCKRKIDKGQGGLDKVLGKKANFVLVDMVHPNIDVNIANYSL